MTASLGFLSKTTWLQNLKIATTKAEILNFSQNQNQARNWNLESINRCQAQSFYNNNNIQISIPPQVARTGEHHLLCGEIKDAFASFRQLKQKCATSTEGTGWETTVRQGICRWQEHFSTLLNRPTQSPPDDLLSEAQASTPDSTIDNFPPMITEVHKAMNKIKAGKTLVVCGIYPEYIQHGGSDALHTLHRIVTQKKWFLRNGTRASWSLCIKEKDPSRSVAIIEG